MLYLALRFCLRFFIIVTFFWVFNESQIYIFSLKEPLSTLVVSNEIIDRSFEWTTGINSYLLHNKMASKVLITAINFIIDLLFLLLIVEALLNNFKIISGFMIILCMRQLCQYIVALPIPENIIWYNPQLLPTFIGDYGINNDFFFSGHTAAVSYISFALGATYFSHWREKYLIPTLIVIFVTFSLICLRVHYFMDIYAGVMTSFLALLVYFTIPYPAFMEYKIISGVFHNISPSYLRYLKMKKIKFIWG